MIIIEGPDLAGKTTLAEAMSKQIFVPYIHMSSPGPSGDWIEVNKVLLKHGYNNQLIADRFVLSDYAYRPVWPHPVPNTIEQLQHFIAWLRLTASLVIQADVPDEILRARHAIRNDDQVSLENIIKTAHLYRRMFDNLRASRHVQCITYDSSVDTPNHFVLRHYDALLDASVKFTNPLLGTLKTSLITREAAMKIATP